MASYNEVIKFLSDFSTAYFPLKSFGNGEVSELVETFKQKDAEYPKMWAQDMPNTTATGEEVFKFRIYMVDQVATLKEKTDTTLGEDNTNEIKSNMRQFCLDLVSYLLRQTNYPEITTDKNIVLTSVVDEFNDKLTGWYFDLNIRQAFRFSSCILPMSGIAPPPSGICDDALVKNSDGTYSVSVASGATLVLPDITHTQTDGSPETLPAQTALVCDPPTCADGVAENSDATFQTNVPSGGTTVLSDTTYEVYVDGVLESSATLPSLVNQTININWT